MARGDTLTAEDLGQWIDNDEGLHRWFTRWTRSNRGGRRAFIRENRAGLETAIRSMLDGTHRPHFLAYGG